MVWVLWMEGVEGKDRCGGGREEGNRCGDEDTGDRWRIGEGAWDRCSESGAIEGRCGGIERIVDECGGDDGGVRSGGVEGVRGCTCREYG